jgi:hypothetical protein
MTIEPRSFEYSSLARTEPFVLSIGSDYFKSRVLETVISRRTTDRGGCTPNPFLAARADYCSCSTTRLDAGAQKVLLVSESNEATVGKVEVSCVPVAVVSTSRFTGWNSSSILSAIQNSYISAYWFQMSDCGTRPFEEPASYVTHLLASR